MKNISYPDIRIRGKVGQATEPEEVQGKWFFQIWLTTFGGGEGESLGHFGPFETEDIAQAELRKASQMISETITEKITGKKSGLYIDMKDNQLKSWEKEEESA